MTVPLDWQKSVPDTIPYFVYRLTVAGAAPSPAQLWIINGGPGDDGSLLLPVGQLFLEALPPGYDVFLPDHRGTGHSSYLSCPNADDLPACAAYLNATWGDLIHFFRTTQAAQDTAYGIQQAASDFGYTQNYVYGVSYGSYLTNRLLAMFPDIVDGAVLDGVCSTAECRLAGWDRNTNEMGTELLDLCTDSPACINRLGFDPVATAEQMFAQIDAGTLPCQQKLSISRADFTQFFFPMLASWSARPLIPAVIYRLLRCNEDDIAALSYRLFQPAAEGEPQRGTPPMPQAGDAIFSPVLQALIGASELFSMTNATVPTLNDTTTSYETSMFATGSGVLMSYAYEYLNRYGPDEWTDVFATNFARPLLLLVGDLDPQTVPRWADAAATHYERENQQLIIVPYAAHGTIFRSPVDNSPFTCGMQIVVEFLTKTSFNASCIDDLLPVDFAGTLPLTQQTAQSIFGTGDIWGDN